MSLGQILRLARTTWLKIAGAVDLTTAFGIPLLLGLLMGLFGWPFSWSGDQLPDPQEVTPKPVEATAAVPTGPGTQAENVPGADAASLEVSPSTRDLKLLRELEEARAAQLEVSGALAALRSRFESDLAEARDERDSLAVDVTELKMRLLEAEEALKAGEQVSRDWERERTRRQDLERQLILVEAARIDRASREARWRHLQRVQEEEHSKLFEAWRQQEEALREPEPVRVEAEESTSERSQEEWTALRELYLEAQERLADSVRRADG